MAALRSHGIADETTTQESGLRENRTSRLSEFLPARRSQSSDGCCDRIVARSQHSSVNWFDGDALHLG